MEETKSVFDDLYSVNVNDYTEDREGLTYLTWSFAWAEVKKRYPDATYEIEKFNGLPYVHDENTGFMVYTNVTIEGITHEMWLPVMDSKNKAMKTTPWEYETKTGKKTVQPATMFDINKTIMRCLVKNLAMFGLGLYIYAGEDLPEAEKEEQKKTSEKETIEELKVLYDKAGGKNFEKWIDDCGGLNPANFPLMKTKLLKQINDKAEKGDKK